MFLLWLFNSWINVFFLYLPSFLFWPFTFLIFWPVTLSLPFLFSYSSAFLYQIKHLWTLASTQQPALYKAWPSPEVCSSAALPSSLLTERICNFWLTDWIICHVLHAQCHWMIILSHTFHSSFCLLCLNRSRFSFNITSPSSSTPPLISCYYGSSRAVAW